MGAGLGVNETRSNARTRHPTLVYPWRDNERWGWGVFHRISAVALIMVAGFASREAIAQGQLSLGLMMICTELKDNAERLQCFDKLVAETLKAPPQAAASNSVTTEDQNWKVTESKSPVDDSPQLAAVLEATEGSGALVMRCYDKISEAYMNLRTYVGGIESLRVIYRLNQSAPVETRWSPAKSGDAVFVPASGFFQFVRELPDDGTLFVRLFDFQSRSFDLTFNLGPMTELRAMFTKTCRWPAEQAVAERKPAEAAAAGPTNRPRSAKHIVITPQHAQHWSVNSQRK
jgi:hypothetical protein